MGPTDASEKRLIGVAIDNFAGSGGSRQFFWIFSLVGLKRGDGGI
jgi:hypothetical protein